MGRLSSSTHPQWIAGRWTLGAGIAFVLAVAGLALTGCARKDDALVSESIDRKIDVQMLHSRIDFVDEEMRSLSGRIDRLERKK